MESLSWDIRRFEPAPRHPDDVWWESTNRGDYITDAVGDRFRIVNKYVKGMILQDVETGDVFYLTKELLQKFRNKKAK